MSAREVQTPEPTGGRGVVRRVSLVLDAFATQSSWGVRDLAAHLGVPRSGLHRVLQELAMEGLVVSDDQGSYAIGAGLLRLAARLTNSVDLTRVAHDHLVTASQHVGETTILVAFDRGRQQMIAVDSVESLQPVQFPWAALRDWTDLHLSASGKSILASLSTAELKRYFSQARLTTFGEDVDINDLQMELNEIRLRGWAVSHGERVPGTRGVGSAVFDAGGRVVGCVVIAWPDRTVPADEERIGQTCRAAALAISEDLGRENLKHAAGTTEKPATRRNV